MTREELEAVLYYIVEMAGSDLHLPYDDVMNRFFDPSCTLEILVDDQRQKLILRTRNTHIITGALTT